MPRRPMYRTLPAHAAEQRLPALTGILIALGISTLLWAAIITMIVLA